MLDDAKRRHVQALTAAFEFAQTTDFSWNDGAAESYANQVRIVLDCIAQRVPFGTDGSELMLFFVNRAWPARGDTLKLWRAYVQAGYIDPEQLVQMHCKRGPLLKKARHGFVKLLPLEMAIAIGNEAGAKSLLLAGAKASSVPSQPWKESKKPMDIFGFIKHVARGDASRFRAMAAKSLGATQLEQAVFDGDVDSFRALLDGGATIATVPSRAWQPPSKKPMDVKGFIKFACADAAKRNDFEVLATAAMMSERIRNTPKQASAPKTRPPLKVTGPVEENAGASDDALLRLTPLAQQATSDISASGSEVLPDSLPPSRRRRVGI